MLFEMCEFVATRRKNRIVITSTALPHINKNKKFGNTKKNVKEKKVKWMPEWVKWKANENISKLTYIPYDARNETIS